MTTWRGDRLNQLTIDHSVAAAAGVDDESEIPLLFRGVITKAVGIKKVLDAEYETIDLQAGDLYLICSDGLTGFVRDTQLAQLLDAADPEKLDETTSALIAAANEGGGKDNISAILIHIGTLPEAPVPADQLTSVIVPDDEELRGIRESIAAHQSDLALGELSHGSEDFLSESGGMSDSHTDSTDSIIVEQTVAQPTPNKPAARREVHVPELVTRTNDEAPGTRTMLAIPQALRSNNKMNLVVGALIGLALLGVFAGVWSLLHRDPAPPVTVAPPPPVETNLPTTAEPPAPIKVAVIDTPAPAPPSPTPEELLQEKKQKLTAQLAASQTTGSWGTLDELLAASGLTLSDTSAAADEIALTKKWIEIWKTLQADPNLAEEVYNSLFVHLRQLDELRASWNPSPLPAAGLSLTPELRADQVCFAIQQFKTQGPQQADDLGNRLRKSLLLFTIDRKSIIPDLQTFYNITTSLGDTDTLRRTIPEAQMANKQLMDFRRVITQSPSAYLTPTPTPDFAAPEFTRTVKAILAGIELVTDRSNFEQAVKLFEGQMATSTLTDAEKTTGTELLKSVQTAYDALSLYLINHPTKLEESPEWLAREALELHAAHFQALHDFNAWNRTAFNPPGTR